MFRKLLPCAFLALCACSNSENIPTSSTYAAIPFINFHSVENGLYRSGSLTAANIKDLVSKYGVKTIISLDDYGSNPAGKTTEVQSAKDNGIKWVHLPIDPVIEHLNINQVIQAVDALKNEQRPLLVHCARGADRTGIVIGAYRISVNKWAYNNAVTEMNNLGFNRILKPWQDELYRWSLEQ